MYDMHELRSKNRQELLSLISELKGKLLALRFETATGQLTETHLIKNTKQDIAKIFTVLKEQEKGIVIKEKVLPEKSKRRFGRKSVTSTVEEENIIDEKIVEAPLSNLENKIAPLKEKVEEKAIIEATPVEEKEVDKQLEVEEVVIAEEINKDKEIVEKDLLVEEKEEKGNS